MERIVIGLPNFTIEKVVSVSPVVFEASFVGKVICPGCGGSDARIKDTFWRLVRNIPLREGPSTLKVKCHKHICRSCGRYFNTRLPGVKLWSRTTELLKSNIFRSYNKGCTCKDIARENKIGTASVERYYHQMIKHEASHWKDRPCPRMLGIDEHRFTRRQGFLTTFCDLGKHRIFDIAQGRSAAEMDLFLRSLRGRERVRVVCIDMNSAYRRMVREWFPNARIVSDRFHVIRLINQHFSEVCKKLDEPGLAHGRGRLMRLMLTNRANLGEAQKERLRRYFIDKPFLEPIYNFMHELGELLRVKERNATGCRRYVSEFLAKVRELKQTPFAPLKTLGKTLYNWREEVARMFRYTKNNGITEGFHRKMKLIQRRAYGFRNFENYRLRVRVLCC